MDMTLLALAILFGGAVAGGLWLLVERVEAWATRHAGDAADSMIARSRMDRPPRPGHVDRKIVARLFPRSQRQEGAVDILTPVEAESARCVHTSRRLGSPSGW
jgi:hypothetical protein